MYDSDGAVEKDVQALRRRLKAEDVDRQVTVRQHNTLPYSSESPQVWWVVSVPTGAASLSWFYLERDGGTGAVRVKDPRQNMKVVATLPTVESAYFAGVMIVERPS